MEFDGLSNQVIGCAIEVHRHLDPGLLESAYEQCLSYELQPAGIRFQTQIALPIEYKQVRLDCAYRIDVLVNNQLIPRTQNRRNIIESSRSPALELHETGKDPRRNLDQFQR